MDTLAAAIGPATSPIFCPSSILVHRDWPDWEPCFRTLLFLINHIEAREGSRFARIRVCKPGLAGVLSRSASLSAMNQIHWPPHLAARLEKPVNAVGFRTHTIQEPRSDESSCVAHGWQETLPYCVVVPGPPIAHRHRHLANSGPRCMDDASTHTTNPTHLQLYIHGNERGYQCRYVLISTTIPALSGMASRQQVPSRPVYMHSNPDLRGSVSPPVHSLPWYSSSSHPTVPCWSPARP